MENPIYDSYLRRMRETLKLEGGAAARKQLVEEMRQTGDLTIDQVYKIYFSAMLPITGIYGT